MPVFLLALPGAERRATKHIVFSWLLHQSRSTLSIYIPFKVLEHLYFDQIFLNGGFQTLEVSEHPWIHLYCEFYKYFCTSEIRRALI